jgi:hypothetical protein
MVKYEQDPRDKTDDSNSRCWVILKRHMLKLLIINYLDGTATDADMQMLINELPIKS